jgi:hypothetical protein
MDPESIKNYLRMSEEKIIKHAENAIHVLENKEKGWKRKILEFGEEIIIIVFAVSITLMFHNLNDAHRERRIEREFLSGLRDDLRGGASNLEIGIKEFQSTIDYYDTVWNQITTNKINARFIDENSGKLINTSYFVFDDGRFEGFKFSGNLRLIENQQLLKHIMSLYTVSIPFEVDADKNVFHLREQSYITYIGAKDISDLNNPGSEHPSKLVNDPAFRFQISRYVWIFAERKEHKLRVITKMREVADEIDKELTQ